MADDEPIDLTKLSLSELAALSRRLSELIEKKRSQGREWLREHGKKELVELEVRYQNPRNRSETWSGKGAQPSWVSEALARGETLRDLELSDDRPVPKTRRDRGNDPGK